MILLHPMKESSDFFSSREERRRAGISCRHKVSRFSQGQFDPTRRKFDPVALMNAAHKQRLSRLMPLKNARMSISPFTFYRGAAPLMAADLAALPRTGLLTQICGDAHVQNLGAFGGGAEGHMVFDINDFDETIRAPWEWDVKRMATSLILAGREARNSERQCKDAVLALARSYRESMSRFAKLSFLELARYLVMRDLEVSPVRSVLRKAERATPLNSLEKLTERKDGKFVFRQIADEDFGAKTQYPVGEETARQVLSALPGYLQTLLPERRHFFKQYRPLDLAFRVVGTGSVGTRDYVVLMFGGALDDPMFLQLKQELPSAYAPYVPANVPPKHHGNGSLRACGACWCSPIFFWDGPRLTACLTWCGNCATTRPVSKTRTWKAGDCCSMQRCAAKYWPKVTPAPAIPACCRDTWARRTVSTKHSPTLRWTTPTKPRATSRGG